MRRRGLSLAEVLVTVAVVAVLLAVALPAITAVMRTARATNCLVRVRSAGQIVAGYTLDHRDTFPHFADIESEPAFTNAGYGLEYWLQGIHWPMVMQGRLGDLEFSESRLCPDNPLLDEPAESIARMHPPGYVHPSDFTLAHGFFSDPRLWTPGADTDDRSLYRAVRTVEVRFPSAKGMLAETVPWHRREADMQGGGVPASALTGSGAEGRYHVAMADGSAGRLLCRDLVPGVTPGGRPGSGPPVLATPDGVHGRDVSPDR